MYKNRTIAVVVPAYNEEKLIRRVVKTMPEYVDKIVVVDDKSRDKTVEVIRKHQNPSASGRIILIQHEKNRGVGAAMATGYKWVRDNEMDVAVIMAGDAQMDPDDLPKLLDPIVEGRTDYAKGNRLFTGDAWNQIPRIRYLGNSFLSLLTKIASGYWHVADSQTGYTATTLQVLQTLDWDGIYKRYGVPNDILVRLNVYNFRVMDIPVKPVYNIGEKSGIKLYEVIPRMSWLLLKKFLWRMKEKYVIRDFHPLIFFYTLAFLLLFVSVPLTIRLFYMWIIMGYVPRTTALAIMFCIITGLQSLFFAMWFDMESNKHLK